MVQDNTHYHLWMVGGPAFLTAPNVARGFNERLPEQYSSREVALEARRQLCAQQNIVIDSTDIRRCKGGCI